MPKNNEIEEISGFGCCGCPTPSNLQVPLECLQDINPDFESIKFYGASMVATDQDHNYLGQWELVKEEMCIKITKQPYVVLMGFDIVTGEAVFLDHSDDHNAMPIQHTEPIEMWVNLTSKQLTSTMLYLSIGH